MSDTPQIELTEEALEAAAQKAIAAFEAASDLDELSAARRDHLGDGGYIPQARQSLGQLPKDQRKDAGRAVNMARGKVEKTFAQIREVLEQEARAAQLKAEKVDVTIPTTRAQTGALHPITALSERIADIFVGMGCMRYRQRPPRRRPSSTSACGPSISPALRRRRARYS